MPSYSDVYNDNVGYVYAPYIPWYAPAGFKRLFLPLIEGIDESYHERVVFIIRTSQGTMRYDYDTRVAWNSCYSIKSKNKLCEIRKSCNEYIKRAAKNEPEIEQDEPITVNFSYYTKVLIKASKPDWRAGTVSKADRA